MLVKRALFFLGILAILCVSSCRWDKTEDTPQQRKVLALEIVHLVFGNGVFDEIMSQSVEQGMQVMVPNMQIGMGRELTQSEYVKAKRAFEKAFLQTFPQKLWEEPMAEMYTKHFTSDDLQVVLEFYKTPTGITFLKKQATLTSEGAQIGIKLVESRQEEFSKTFENEIEKEFSK